jgi:putative FmdB family regulatory protein
MPIYEYQCQACEHQMEVLQKISDEPLLDCPACTRPALSKMISAAGFRLKGGGWYETDFKSGSKKNLAGEQKSGDSKPDAKAGSPAS